MKNDGNCYDSKIANILNFNKNVNYKVKNKTKKTSSWCYGNITNWMYFDMSYISYHTIYLTCTVSPTPHLYDEIYLNIFNISTSFDAFFFFFSSFLTHTFLFFHISIHHNKFAKRIRKENIATYKRSTRRWRGENKKYRKKTIFIRNVLLTLYILLLFCIGKYFEKRLSMCVCVCVRLNENSIPKEEIPQ